MIINRAMGRDERGNICNSRMLMNDEIEKDVKLEDYER
jgi:hypothetical protein